MSASAGRVLIIPKGDYSASVTYGNLDMVYYGGKTYVCKKTSLNNLPTNTEYWQLMVEGVAGSYYGTCSTAAATAEKAVTISADQHFALFVGASITVKFTNTNTANNPTINVNGTGVASVVYGSGVITTGTLAKAGTAHYSMTYVYDGTNWCWVSSGADDNTTYSPQKLGIGYGTCSTAAATAEKAVTLSGYELITNGTIAVKFTNAVPASATLKVNSKTAKAIYYRGSAITANKIKAGDTAIFYYNGSQYHLICVDRPLDATDVTYSSGVTVKAKIDTKADKTDIATVESGTTASRAYSVGELVYVSGTLYRVKTAIASGATFTVGTNIEVTNVSSAIAKFDRGSVSVTADGVKSFSTLLSELHALVDYSKVNAKSVLTIGQKTYHVSQLVSNAVSFSFNVVAATAHAIETVGIGATPVYYSEYADATPSIVINNIVSIAASNGTVITLYY